MLRPIVWLFIIQFATGHNPLAELVRLPSLLEHYREHRAETPDITIAQYLWLHYGDSSHEQSDNRHENLPLHCSHGTFAATTLPQPQQLHFQALAQPEIARAPLPISEEFLRLSPVLTGVFRPPVA